MSTGVRPEALEAAGLIADRLSDPAEVAARTRSIPSNGPNAWDEQSLTRGSAALGLLAAEYAGEDSAQALTTAWQQTVTATARSSVDGPFGGLGSLASLARCVSAPAEVLTRLDTRVAEHARWLGTALDAQIGQGSPSYAGTVDALGGLAGEGRYLLARNHLAAATVVEAMAPLAGTLTVNGVEVPGWWAAPTERTVVAPEFEHGQLCFGLAHGIAGPLMFLALAREQGVRSATLDETARTLVENLWNWREEDDHGTYWTSYLPLSHLVERPARRPDPARASWCYGSLGIAHVLDQFGRAFGLPLWRERAIEVARAQLARPDARLGIRDVGLCHGWAGHLFLLDSLVRSGVLGTSGGAAHDVAVVARRGAARRVLDHVDSGYPFGVRMPHPASGDLLDLPGLLEGAAGVALALLAFGRDEAPRTEWDTLLMLR